KIVMTLPDGTKVSEFDEMVAKRFKAGFDETGVIAVDKEASRFAKEVTFTKDLDGILELDGKRIKLRDSGEIPIDI
ncbi:MAG: hypothetical protein EBY38_04985, partial [Flavobacteriaceae bacterium]|nr:hypothetical protein [Flavobacteriaceae bacterium]